jgi:hypothetical protein
MSLPETWYVFQLFILHSFRIREMCEIPSDCSYAGLDRMAKANNLRLHFAFIPSLTLKERISQLRYGETNLQHSERVFPNLGLRKGHTML